MQCDGKKGGSQPYRKQIASLKVLLCRAEPYLAIGRAFSQLDAPFSLAISTDRFCLTGSIASNLVFPLLYVGCVPGSFPQVVGSHDQKASKLHG